MRVEVVYALPSEQHVIAADVAPGATAIEAVQASGLAQRIGLPEAGKLELARFGRHCAHDAVLRPGDRVEILRPLQVDPMEARRLRARRGRN